MHIFFNIIISKTTTNSLTSGVIAYNSSYEIQNILPATKYQLAPNTK